MVRTAWLRLARLGAADRGFRRGQPRLERHSIRMAHLLIVPGGVAGPAFQSLMSGKMRPDQQSRLQGAAVSLFSVASIVEPVAFTQLVAWTIAASRPAILGDTARRCAHVLGLGRSPMSTPRKALQCERHEGVFKMTLAHGTERLESARLVLRRIAPDDLPFFTRIHALPEVAQHLYPGGRPRSLARRDGRMVALHSREL